MINRKKIVSVCLVVILVILSGCINENKDYKTPDQIIKEMSENLVKFVMNEDTEGINALLCPRFKDTNRDIDSQIQGMFDFIEGDIVSYDEPTGAGCGGRSTAEEGWVEKLTMPNINNIKTTSNKTYQITYVYNFINKEEPDLVVIETINVILVGDETGKLTGKLKKYRISASDD